MSLSLSVSDYLDYTAEPEERAQTLNDVLITVLSWITTKKKRNQHRRGSHAVARCFTLVHDVREVNVRYHERGEYFPVVCIRMCRGAEGERIGEERHRAVSGEICIVPT